MKKIFISLAIIALTSCYMKGDYTLGPRNTFNDYFYTYSIKYYKNNNQAIQSKEAYIVSNPAMEEINKVSSGEIFFYAEEFDKEFFADNIVKPNKDGSLVSYTIPVNFNSKQFYSVIGESIIDGKTYRLIEPTEIGDVVLIDNHGKIYNRIGKIYNNRLALLATAFTLEPRDIRFNSSFKNERRVSNSDFTIRYKGLENDNLAFETTSLDDDDDYTSHEKRTIYFPMNDKTIKIRNYTFEVLNIDGVNIEYRLISQ